MILLWIGDISCTWGGSNNKTGKHSFLGGYIRFKTVQDRKWWLDNAVFYGCFNAYICNEKTGRKFDLGNSVYAYNEQLNMLDFFICDDNDIPVIYS